MDPMAIYKRGAVKMMEIINFLQRVFTSFSLFALS